MEVQHFLVSVKKAALGGCGELMIFMLQSWEVSQEEGVGESSSGFMVFSEWKILYWAVHT